MFLPGNQVSKQQQSNPNTGKVQLKSSHIWIDQQVATDLFGNSPNVNMVYYPERRTLMLAKKDDELFSSLHKAKQYMLKSRSAMGDKAIAIHEILIDHEIDSTDRDLEYTAGDGSGILSLQL